MTAYDCDKMDKGETKYSMLDTEDCPEASPPSFLLLRNNIPYLVYQESDYYHAEAKECIVKVSTVIFHCGMYSYTSLVDPGYTPTEIVIDRQT